MTTSALRWVVAVALRFSTRRKGSQATRQKFVTCLMAVTVMTKKRGRPLVTGEVGVSIINWKDKESKHAQKCFIHSHDWCVSPVKLDWLPCVCHLHLSLRRGSRRCGEKWQFVSHAAALNKRGTCCTLTSTRQTRRFESFLSHSPNYFG